MLNPFKIIQKRFSKGFSAIEYIIAAILLAIIFVNVGKTLVSAINNGQLTQKAVDTNDLASRKVTQLLNDAKNQVAKIPPGQTQIGSIDPNEAITGFFDLFNESGCLLNSTKLDQPPIDGGPKGGLGSSGTETSTVDCSTANYTKPSQSPIPKFRRQWLIKKDFPNSKDVTFAVIVVYTNNNTIARSKIITKSDGITGK